MTEVRAAFLQHQREAARATAMIGAAVAAIGLPLWTVFDRFVAPERAGEFLAVRVGFGTAIALNWLALRSPRIGGRWPLATSFAALALVQMAIAWMIPRVGPDVEPYALGLSLPVYAAGFLLVWRWQLTLLVVMVTAAFTAVFWIVAPVTPPADQLATLAFYLGTAGAIALAAQFYREHTEWLRFSAQAALEAERDRNLQLVAELDALSREDPLTGAGNRRAWEERLTLELARARRTGHAVSVIVGDIDHFKTVNDTLGHAAGDRVLAAVADMLRARTRSTDFVARLGGDEFCVVCPETTLLDAEALASQLVEIARTTDWPHEAAVTLSLGVAEARPGEMDPGELVQRADRALYEAKTVRDAVRIG